MSGTTILTISLPAEGAKTLLEPDALAKLNAMLTEANLPTVISISPVTKSDGEEQAE